ncbi:hypothetical protein FOG51_03559 [Hanseniaspora uvarum]|uniref:WKF domain-containing protein n=1 Tax=Hanseniaspora uvarum TaxID=29833 RepID=A0A1E5RIV7_HANUV|nr:hypothetical protein FOG51_03559 [Hanseniaspora uvarum]OEJ86804.1 Uncharacterized protein AWRI3580_g2564 [Hanseniaspora uvarum]
MSEENIPAWKKKLNISSLKSSQNTEASNDSLKVVKHLSTSNILSKKDKKNLINERNRVNKTKKDKTRNKTKIADKVEKIDHLNTTFLKDHFKYLIEYYIYKYSIEELPEEIKNLENVKKNMVLDVDETIKSWKFNKNKQNWLLKNVFVHDKKSDYLSIPKVYDLILVEYFINLPADSGIKKDLIERSWKLLHQWNEGIIKQKENMMKILNEESKEEEKEEDKEKIDLPNKDLVLRAHEIVSKLDKTNASTFELQMV